MVEAAMELDAVEETPSSEEAVAETNQETTEDELLSAKFDEIRSRDAEGEKTDEAPTQPEDETVDEKEPEGEQKQEVAAPSYVPEAAKAVWKDLPENVRDAIASSQKEMSDRVGMMGREASALKPIREILVKAVEELPGLAEMKPEQVGDEVFKLARLTSNFQAQPVETILGLIEANGLAPAVAQAMGQTQGVDGRALAELQAENRALRIQVQNASDPESLRQRFSEWTAEERVNSEVSEFSSKAEHWGAVEPYLPQFIGLVRNLRPEGTSNTELLKEAYDMAVSKLVPTAQAQTNGAVTEAAPTPDPGRAEAVANATSVNISGRRSGRQRELTEDEIMSAAYDRAHARA